MRAIFAAAAEEIFRSVDVEGGDVVSVAFAELGGSGARDMLHKGAACQMLTDANGDVQLVPTLEVAAADAAMISASVDEREMHIWRLLAEATTAPAMISHQPVVDLSMSQSLSQ